MIHLDQIRRIGCDLNRPECVLSTRNGRLYSADWRGGICIIEPGGEQWLLLSKDQSLALKPNGICLMPDGSVLVAHLGAEHGGVYRIAETGDVSAFCLEVDGVALPPSNYVHLDALGRVWITVSTRKIPRSEAYNSHVTDGFVVLVDAYGARVVADSLGYTNECLVDPSGRYLYVNETFGRQLVRYSIGEQGELRHKETVAEFGFGTFPDGMTFDCEGGVWITSIVSNRVLRVAPDGAQVVLVEDCDEQHLQWVEQAFQAGEMGRAHLDNTNSKKLKNVSSLAFGGASLDTAFLGCLLDDCIYAFNSPVKGYSPVHWDFAGPRKSSMVG